MALLTFAAFDNPCTSAVSLAADATPANMSTATEAQTTSEPAGSRYTVAAIALLLWMGTLQVGWLPANAYVLPVRAWGYVALGLCLRGV